MATPVLSHHTLSGALGPILVDVRTANRDARQPAVLIMHGFKGFKDYAFLPVLAERLARAGFTAITVTVSGAGVDEQSQFTAPERFARNTYTREMGDLHCVLDALQNGELGIARPSSIGMVGHSRGGGVALCVTRERSEIAALVTWAAIATIRRYPESYVKLWESRGRIEIENARTQQMLPMDYEIVVDALAHADRFDMLAAAATLEQPWMLIHGTDDETVPLAEGRELASVATAPHFSSLFIEGGTHTFGARHPWSGHTVHTEQLFGATVSFLSRHLR